MNFIKRNMNGILLIVCVLSVNHISNCVKRSLDVDQQTTKLRHSHHRNNSTNNDLNVLFNREKFELPSKVNTNFSVWPLKRVSEMQGDIILGGLMMVHEREDKLICGKIMPQGGIQALECMLYTIDWINKQDNFLPGITLGAYILDDCDKDTYGLEQAVDFIKGFAKIPHFSAFRAQIANRTLNERIEHSSKFTIAN